MGSLLQRILHHEPGSILNVMELRFSRGLVGKPHYNKDRDEVMVVLQGSLEIWLYDQNLKVYCKKMLCIDSTNLVWTLIPMNIIHQINVLSQEATVLEMLGGSFFEGACVDVL